MKQYVLFSSGFLAIALTSYFSLLPLNDVTQDDISALYPTLFTPAPFTFSIWSIIYFSWIILGITTVIDKKTIPWDKTLYLANAQLVSALWLVPWHYDYIGLSLVVMILIAVQLTYLALNPEKNTLYQNTVWLFFAWIVVATLANFHVFLVAYEAYSKGLMLSVTSIIASIGVSYYFYKYFQTIILTLVVMWALLGILFLQNDHYIALTSMCGIMFLLFNTVAFFIDAETPDK